MILSKFAGVVTRKIRNVYTVNIRSFCFVYSLSENVSPDKMRLFSLNVSKDLSFLLKSGDGNSVT